MSLAGKTLFITGASRGIGLAIALRAARDGANIAIAAKTAEPHKHLPGTIYTAAKLVGDLGRQLGDAIKDGKVPRGVLRRLIGIHTLWHRSRQALAENKGLDAAEAAKRQWLWAYHLGRAQAGVDADGAAHDGRG